MGATESDGVRCAICGRRYNLDEVPEFRARLEAEHRHAKERHDGGARPVFICDLCAGKVRYEADREQKGTRPI